MPRGDITAQWLGRSPGQCEAKFGAEMLEDNLTSRLPTSGSKCFTHPDIQKKVNTPFLCFTQKNYAENNVCAQWSMGVCGQQALHQQLDWAPVSSRVKHMKRGGGLTKDFLLAYHILFHHTQKHSCTLMRIRLDSHSVLLGLGKETTLAPVTQWTALVEVIFMMAFYWDATRYGALLWWESTPRTWGHHTGNLRFLEQVPALELLHPCTSSLHPILTGQPLCPYSPGEPAASWMVDPFVDRQPPVCHPLLALASQTHAELGRGYWTKYYHPVTPTSCTVLGTGGLELPSTSS